MKSKSLLVTVLIYFMVAQIFAQCPASGTKVPVAKILNPTLAAEYEKCDVVLEAEFAFSTVTLYNHPKPMTKLVVFQVAPIGEVDKYEDTRGKRGLFIAVDKSKSDPIFELKKGDRIELRGHTYIYNGMGQNITYFVTDYIKKL